MKKWLIFILLVGFIQQSFSQRIKQVSMAATTEAIGLPFTNYLPYHPGFEAGATFFQKEKNKNLHSLSGKLGFYYHEKLETGIYLGAEYQYSLQLFNEKVSFDLPIGLGYIHTFYPGELYEQDANGDFQTVTQFGRPHLYVNLGIGATYTGSNRFQPFIRQELMVVTPFANGIPVIPHSFLKIGLQIKLGKK